MVKLASLIPVKPGNETEVLSRAAKEGLTAIEQLVEERNSAVAEVARQDAVIQRLQAQNESLRMQCISMQQQRDFWMRSGARIEAHLNNLFAQMKTLHDEIHRGDETRQLASEGQNESAA